MKKSLISSCVLVAGLSVLSAAEVTVGGLRVHFESADKEFNMPSELEVTLILDEFDGKVLGFDDDASELSKCQDSTGRDLTGKAKWWSFGNTTQDNEAVEVKVKSEALPAAGASHIDIEGKAVVTTGSKTETESSEVIDLKKGGKLEVAGFKLEVKEAKETQWGNAKWTLSFQSSEPFDKVAEFTILDADGKAVKTEKGGWSSMGMMGVKTYTQSLNLAKPVERGSLQIKYYTDFQKVEVPVKVRAGLGR